MQSISAPSLKRYTIAGLIFVLITGTLAHFAYEWSGCNRLLGLFFPVSESTWEHMKLVFFPLLLYSLFMTHKLKDSYPCIRCSLMCGIITGTFLIPVIFYTYSGILGRNYMFLDIATFTVSVIAAFAVIYRLTGKCTIMVNADRSPQFSLQLPSQQCLPDLSYLPMRPHNLEYLKSRQKLLPALLNIFFNYS